MSIYIEGMRLGEGVNPDLKTTHGQAIEGEYQTPTWCSPTSAPTSQYSLTIVENQDQLMQVLELSGSLDYSYSGIFTQSLGARFLQQHSLSRYSTYIIAKCVIRFQEQTIPAPKLKPEVIEQAKELTQEEFEQIYGTAFVSGVVHGGTYFGVIEIESTTQEQQAQISMAVANSGWGTTAAISISNELAKVTRRSNTKVFAVREGFQIGQGNPVTVDDMIGQVVDFGKANWDLFKVVEGIYKPYSAMSKLDFKSTPGEFRLYNRKQHLDLLGRRFVELLKLRKDFEFVRQHFNDCEKGTGIVFSIDGQPIQDLKSIEQSQLSTLKSAATTDANPELIKESRELTLKSIKHELNRIENHINKTAAAADACKLQNEYEIPEPYIAEIGLPEIYGENMELKRIRGLDRIRAK